MGVYITPLLVQSTMLFRYFIKYERGKYREYLMILFIVVVSIVINVTSIPKWMKLQRIIHTV